MQTPVTPRLRAPRILAATIAAFVIAVLGMLVFGVPALADTTFTFDGGGWGHGIGLSQWGSRGYALQGKTYDWIIEHYYQGTFLKTMPAVTVRVNLDDGKGARSQWQIKAGSTTALRIAQVSDSSVSISLDATSRYWIKTANGNDSVWSDTTDASGVHKPYKSLKTFTGAAFASAGGFVQIIDPSGPFNHNGIVWRGTIRFLPYGTSTSKAVNYVGLEQYLYGVVPRESPSSWPAEALKAQAVAARSYAYQDAVDGATIWCTTMSQVYNGYATWSSRNEVDSSNAAVDATKSRVVWYGSETTPVQTFFSSSSGGHTANIEDVWLDSTPKPYYTGVSDADQADPNYHWTVGPLSADYVADQIRAHVSSGSEPSPATITGMTLDTASSGYTRYATLRWSNGAVHTIRGTELRAALGMKSTHFSLRPVWTSQEQTDGRIAWVGPWSNVPRSTDWGGSSLRSKAGESRLWVTYHGTGFSWVGTKAGSFGKAEVYVDGAYKATVDLYSASPVDRQTIYSISGQSDATHTVSIRVLGTKSAKSTGTWVDVDRVMVKSGDLVQASVPQWRVEENNANIAGIGNGWSTGLGVPNSTDKQAMTKHAGDKVVVTFVGDRISWLSFTGASRGIAKVSIDGGAPVDVDTYTAASTPDNAVWTSPKLAWGTHQVVITATGTKAPASTDSYISVQAFTLPGCAIRRSAVRAEESDPGLTWNGVWKSAASTANSGGNAKVSTAAGAGVTATFTGTVAKWIGLRAPSLGKAAIYIDGTKIGVVDCYGSTLQRQTALFTRTGLTNAQHTLRIVVLHEKSTSSTGYSVYVDAFEIAGWIK